MTADARTGAGSARVALVLALASAGCADGPPAPSRSAPVASTSAARTTASDDLVGADLASAPRPVVSVAPRPSASSPAWVDACALDATATTRAALTSGALDLLAAASAGDVDRLRRLATGKDLRIQHGPPLTSADITAATTRVFERDGAAERLDHHLASRFARAAPFDAGRAITVGGRWFDAGRPCVADGGGWDFGRAPWVAVAATQGEVDAGHEGTFVVVFEDASASPPRPTAILFAPWRP